MEKCLLLFLEILFSFQRTFKLGISTTGAQKTKVGPRFQGSLALRGHWLHRALFDPFEQMRPLEPDQRAKFHELDLPPKYRFSKPGFFHL